MPSKVKAEIVSLFHLETFIRMVRELACLYDPQDSHYEPGASKGRPLVQIGGQNFSGTVKDDKR